MNDEQFDMLIQVLMSINNALEEVGPRLADIVTELGSQKRDRGQ